MDQSWLWSEILPLLLLCVWRLIIVLNHLMACLCSDHRTEDLEAQQPQNTNHQGVLHRRSIRRRHCTIGLGMTIVSEHFVRCFYPLHLPVLYLVGFDGLYCLSQCIRAKQISAKLTPHSQRECHR
jgi:hypothetical protein